jgi:hypothetical protein
VERRCHSLDVSLGHIDRESDVLHVEILPGDILSLFVSTTGLLHVRTRP